MAVLIRGSSDVFAVWTSLGQINVNGRMRLSSHRQQSRTAMALTVSKLSHCWFWADIPNRIRVMRPIPKNWTLGKSQRRIHHLPVGIKGKSTDAISRSVKPLMSHSSNNKIKVSMKID